MAALIRGFFSYSREDDRAEYGNLTKLRTEIERQLAMRLGLKVEEVELFQDTDELRTGHLFETRLRQAVMQSHFFILISTPRTFRADSYTRKELSWFIERERNLGGGELVIPLAYLPVAEVESADDTAAAHDIYLTTMKHRLVRRWDHLRHVDEHDRTLRSAVDSLVRDICDTLQRSGLQPVSTSAPIRILATSAYREAPSLDANSRGAESSKATTRTAVHVVPEIIVDAYGRADCQRISEAISKATKGERIVVRPGYYPESLIIERPIEIVGAGARGDIIVESNSAEVVKFNTSFGRVAGLTLRGRSDAHFGIDIIQGRFHLEDCDISSRSFSCIAVRGSADPLITRCVVHDSRHSGLYIADRGRGTYEDNNIFGNSLAGISVKEDADPTFRRNRIHDGKASGIFVYSKGRGTYENNDIFGNTIAGVEVKDEADPILRGNRIHDGKEGGVYVHSKGRGTFEDNDIFGNQLGGIEVSKEAEPIFRANRVHDGKGCGVYVHLKGRGTFEDNDIFGNQFGGIEVSEEADPIFRGNRVHDDKEGGVFIESKGRGTFENNDIFGNTIAGVEVKGEADPIFRGNRIHDGKACGVYVHSKGRGTFVDNDIFGNHLSGFEVQEDADPIVRRNRVHSGNDDGLLILKGGKGTFEDNTIEGNRDKGIRLQDGVTPTLRNNTVRNNAGDK